MTNEQIYNWLKEQNYQTDISNEQEYTMYYAIDMPKILEDYYEYKSQIQCSAPTQMNCAINHTKPC